MTLGQCTESGWGFHQFLPYSSLSDGAVKNTQYLYQDCLCPQVVKVEPPKWIFHAWCAYEYNNSFHTCHSVLCSSIHALVIICHSLFFYIVFITFHDMFSYRYFALVMNNILLLTPQSGGQHNLWILISWDRRQVRIEPMFLNLDNSLDKPKKMLLNTKRLTL